MKELHDRYFKQAKREGKLARSYYKLEEIDRRTRLLKKGMRVIDLGACPGSWLEYVLEKIGDTGVACAVDLNPINPKFKGKVQFKVQDIRELGPEAFFDVAPKFHIVLSDMAPNTSGIRIVDQARSQELCEAAAKFALGRLEPGGSFICKIFEGPDTSLFRDRLRPLFREVRMMKPDASRDESIETYLVCMGMGQPPEEKRERPDHEIRKTKGKRTRQY